MGAFKEQIGGNHYKHLAIQPTEYCQRNRLGFCESSVVKYVTRHRHKNGRQDIEKAIHFLQLLLEMEYPIHQSSIIDPQSFDTPPTACSPPTATSAGSPSIPTASSAKTASV